MRIRFIRVRRSFLLAAILLLALADGEAQQRNKQPDISEDDKVYGTGQVDKKAIIDRREYTDNLPSGQGCEEHRGRVLLHAVLRKTGKVSDVEVREKSKCEVFDQRAIKAVKKVKFKPAKKGGVAVSEGIFFEMTYTVQ